MANQVVVFTGAPTGLGRTTARALQRIRRRDEIAGAVAFPASDASRWVTGEIIKAGGGSKL